MQIYNKSYDTALYILFCIFAAFKCCQYVIVFSKGLLFLHTQLQIAINERCARDLLRRDRDLNSGDRDVDKFCRDVGYPRQDQEETLVGVETLWRPKYLMFKLAVYLLL